MNHLNSFNEGKITYEEKKRQLDSFVNWKTIEFIRDRLTKYEDMG